jgi:hypothetical protein
MVVLLVCIPSSPPLGLMHFKVEVEYIGSFLWLNFAAKNQLSCFQKTLARCFIPYEAHSGAFLRDEFTGLACNRVSVI